MVEQTHAGESHDHALLVALFVEMIHPNDIQYYQEQSSVIGSLEVTRIKYRLKLGLGYYYVHEDAMYLNRDGKLISIIHLANYTPKEETKEEESEEIVQSTKEVVKEKPQVDYKEKLEIELLKFTH